MRNWVCKLFLVLKILTLICEESLLLLVDFEIVAWNWSFNLFLRYSSCKHFVYINSKIVYFFFYLFLILFLLVIILFWNFFIFLIHLIIIFRLNTILLLMWYIILILFHSFCILNNYRKYLELILILIFVFFLFWIRMNSVISFL